MRLTISVTGMQPEYDRTILVLVCKIGLIQVIFTFKRIQKKHIGVSYDTFKGLSQNRGWCIQDTVEVGQKRQITF